MPNIPNSEAKQSMGPRNMCICAPSWGLSWWINNRGHPISVQMCLVELIDQLFELVAKLEVGIHEFSDKGYPSHLMRYCIPRPLAGLRDLRIVSMLYCLTPPKILGIAPGAGGPCTLVSTHGKSSPAWKTLWIHHLSGRLSQKFTVPMAPVILNRPYCLLDNLADGYVVSIFFPSSVTKSPTLNSGCLRRWLLC